MSICFAKKQGNQVLKSSSIERKVVHVKDRQILETSNKNIQGLLPTEFTH